MLKLHPKNTTRRYVLVGITGCLATVAGCSNADSETDATRIQTTTQTPTPTPDDGSVESLEANISATGVDVDSISYHPDSESVELTYVSADPQSQDTVTNEIGTITGEFYNRLDAGLDADRLNATIVGPEGESQITWYAKRQWYTQLQNGEISADELTYRVIETAEEV